MCPTPPFFAEFWQCCPISVAHSSALAGTAGIAFGVRTVSTVEPREDAS